MTRPSFARSVLVLALLLGGPLAWTAISHGQEAPPNRTRGGSRGGPGGFGGGAGFGGGGFGGGGFGGGGSQSLLDFANRDEKAQAEVKVSDEDKAKIKELADSLRPDMQAMFARMQAVPTDGTEEEKQKIRDEIRDEMTKEGEERRKTGEAKLKEILSKEQITRLEQLWLRQTGHSALSRDEIATAIKLTEEQKATVKKIQDDYQEQTRAGGFRMPREERDKLRTDRDAKLATVLTADQAKVWEVKLGPAPAETADADATKPATGTSSTIPGIAGAESKPIEAPTGKVVAKLSASDKPESKSDDPSDEPAVKKPTGEKMSFNFRFAPWDMVMKMFAEEAGLTLDMATPPPGTFNYYDKGKYTATEALDILNGYLLQKGWVIVRRDQFLVVLNLDNGIPPNLVPQVTPDDLATHGKNELLSVVFALNGQDTAIAAEEVKAMLGPQGKVVTLSKANRLLVTDIGANLRRVNVLLNGAEGDGSLGAGGFKAFQLKHISATEAERTVRDLFGLAPRSRTVATAPSRTSTSSSSYYRPDDRRGDDRRDDQRRDDRGYPAPMPVAPTPVKERVTLATDLRTNSLMVTANAADIAIVEQAIKTIDVADGSGRSGSAADGGQPQLEVYSLVTADPSTVANTLNSLIPGLTINEDLKAKKLHVYASPGDQRQVRSIISQLDGTASETVSVFPLKRSDPVQVVGTLRSLFVGKREDMPSIEADVAGKRLVIRGTAEQLVQIRTVLQQLGEDGQGGGGSGGVGEGPLRTLSAGKRDPKELISLVERIWSTSTDRNPIHVVVPSAISPATRMVPERRVPSAPPSDSGGEEDEELQEEDSTTGGAIVIDEPKPEASRPQRTRPATGATTDDLLRELMELLDEEAEANSSVKPAGKATTKSGTSKTSADGDATPERRTVGKSSKLPIAISANGNNLIISSDDLEALDRLERLIQSLTQSASSSGTRWTVFYLRSADAAETAQMLGHLFPTGSVSKTSTDSTLMGSLTSGMSSLGGSLMDMTGLNSLGKDTALRIIPEPRSNALFISGTDDQIGQVEEVLKYLDAAELPESLKDRSQHMIAIEYADVQDVYEIVKDVYKEEIEGQSNPFGGGGGGSSRGGSSNFNPLAMMMGGMAGGQNSRNQKGLQLSLGVDNRTNTLIVNANDKLFKQVETLVKSIDESAKVAKQTVRVIPLANANSTIVSQALGSMLGKVKVSTTGGSSTRDSSSRSSSSSSQSPFGTSPFGMSPFGISPFGSSSSSGSDDMRRAFEQRMRERSFGGGSPFGGGFPSSDGGRSSDRGSSSRSRGDR